MRVFYMKCGKLGAFLQSSPTLLRWRHRFFPGSRICSILVGVVVCLGVLTLIDLNHIREENKRGSNYYQSTGNHSCFTVSLLVEPSINSSHVRFIDVHA
jgi:hypothetical protein